METVHEKSRAAVSESRDESLDGLDDESNDASRYQSGMGNHFSSEAIAGALPPNQNSPKSVSYGLYAEQLSGTAFSALRHENLRSWLYRIRPSVAHNATPYLPAEFSGWQSAPVRDAATPPNQMRWDALPLPTAPRDFVEGVVTWVANGDVEAQRGSAVHLYAANRSMENRFIYNADGELLIVPQQGKLDLRTEFGALEVSPGEIVVIPRGVKFRVVLSEPSRGYLGENYGAAFRLPNLGIIGANGLADPRHFLYPRAQFEDRSGSFEIVAKFQGRWFTCAVDRSPLDVVAWHGNYAPYKYDLNLFQTINTVRMDHPDPSIFTVLTSPSDRPGIANVDFVVFPPRWMVAENTFRPPYFHRNIMSEYMGLIHGAYDGKAGGFEPGGGSLHNCMSGHGPDAPTFERAIAAPETPHKISGTLAFMFESSLVYNATATAQNSKNFQKNYLGCWKGLKANFGAPAEEK